MSFSVCRYLTYPALALLSLAILPAAANEELGAGGPVLEVYGNTDDALQVLLGAGGRIDRGIGYIYGSHFETRGRPDASDDEVAALLPRENSYRSSRFGLYAEGHEASSGDGFGLGLFLYKNRSDIEIDRYGLGATLDAAYVVANRVRFHFGADLMPGFLSSDLDTLLEYEWHGGVRITMGPWVDVGVIWRNGRTWDRDYRTRQYEDLTAGLRFAF